MTGFVASQIARINRNFVLIALLLALGAGAIGWLGWDNISAVVFGPRMVSAEELASARFQSDPESYKKIVRVSGAEVRPPFYSARVRKGKGYGTLYCWLLKVGEAELIVEDWSQSGTLTAAGKLGEAQQGIYRAAQASGAGGSLLPVLLDQRDWKETGWVLTICAAGMAIAAAVIGGLLLSWGSNPERHPVRKAVARVGDFESTAVQIDAEMQAAYQQFGAVHLGQTMMTYTSAFKFDVVRLQSIAAARTEWLQQGKTRALFLLMETREGRQVKWHIRKSDADELLASVRAAARLEQNPELV